MADTLSTPPPTPWEPPVHWTQAQVMAHAITRDEEFLCPPAEFEDLVGLRIVQLSYSRLSDFPSKERTEELRRKLLKDTWLIFGQDPTMRPFMERAQFAPRPSVVFRPSGVVHPYWHGFWRWHRTVYGPAITGRLQTPRGRTIKRAWRAILVQLGPPSWADRDFEEGERLLPGELKPRRPEDREDMDQDVHALLAKDPDPIALFRGPAAKGQFRPGERQIRDLMEKARRAAKREDAPEVIARRGRKRARRQADKEKRPVRPEELPKKLSLDAPGQTSSGQQADQPLGAAIPDPESAEPWEVVADVEEAMDIASQLEVIRSLQEECERRGPKYKIGLESLLRPAETSRKDVAAQHGVTEETVRYYEKEVIKLARDDLPPTQHS